MADYPFDDVCKTAEELIGQGREVYQKWTCSNCGSRQTMPDANTMYTKGICEECDSLTDIKKQGCNYMVLYSSVSHTK